MSDQERINIENLPSTIIPSLNHRVAAMLDGQTVYLTLSQIKSLVEEGIDTKVSKAGDTMVGSLELIEEDVWRIRVGVGGYYVADTSVAGVEIPPSGTNGPVFIQLTAGLTGSGQYNHGKIKDETVSGSAPDVSATAIIDFDGSPMDGKTIRLLNTEGRIIRPYPTSGTVLGDAIRNITGTWINDILRGSTATGAFTTTGAPTTNFGAQGSSGTAGTGFKFDASTQVPTAIENRMKMLGETWYRRIA